MLSILWAAPNVGIKPRLQRAIQITTESPAQPSAFNPALGSRVRHSLRQVNGSPLGNDGGAGVHCVRQRLSARFNPRFWASSSAFFDGEWLHQWVGQARISLRGHGSSTLIGTVGVPLRGTPDHPPTRIAGYKQSGP